MTQLKNRMARLEAKSPPMETDIVTGIWLCGPDDEPSSGCCAFLPLGSTEEERRLNREKAYLASGLTVSEAQA